MAIPLTLALTFFNFVGANAARVVLTLYALELGAPASSVGVLGGLLFLFPLLLSWPIGALADRTGARGILLFASCCGAASLVLPFFVRAVPAFYAAAALPASPGLRAWRTFASFIRPQRSCQLPSVQCISSWPRVAKACASRSFCGAGA